MLKKLARWLRILGHDAIYDSELSIKELADLSNSNEIVFLTRRKTFPDGVSFRNYIYVSIDKFDEQLKFVINHFQLNVSDKLFTRCLDCNLPVVQADKSIIGMKVPKRSLNEFEEFCECPKCHKIYWGGAHLTNTKKKLEQIFNQNL